MPEKILIVDDEPMLVSLLSDYLSDLGYFTCTAADGKEALDKLRFSPDLILLDINMPGMNGLELCRMIRDEVSCPILFLTSRASEQDRINGLLLGGDDYITKPFSLPETAARIAAHLRREARNRINSRLLASRELLVNLSDRTVHYKGEKIDFSRREFDIIEFLITHAGQVFDRERIYEGVWGLDAEGDSGVIKEHISKIRQKLKKTAGQDYIETVWGGWLQMEAVKQKSRLSGLRQSFILYVLTTFLLVAVLSVLVIWSCLSLQNYLLPDSDQVYLTVQSDYPDGSSTSTTMLMSLNDALQEIPRNVPTEYNSEDPSAGEPDVRYSVTSIENSFSALSPRRKLAYRGSQIGMTALPVLFSLAGILLCGLTFYRRKLKTPISLLASASREIAGQNLDFQISCGSRDEMGMLCDSFEKMRQTLKENYRKLWRILEERRELQGSVAHDLRNPIAIIQGYAQYLQFHLAKEHIDRNKVLAASDHIMQTAQRLDRYTESLKTISRLEELEIHPRPVSFSTLSDRMSADLSLLTEREHLELNWENTVSEQEISLDAKILYRILENLIGNAVRFAEKEIFVRFSCKSGALHVTVSDDGSGFPDKILNSTSRYASIDSDGTHSGMGLAICRVLCRNHGGSLTLRNGEQGGAVVSFTLSI